MIGATLLAALSSNAPDSIDFTREVRPILAEHCLACHGPDPVTREAGLRLDDADSARAAGIFQGSPSELVYRVAEAEDFERMPPPESGERLEAAEIDVLRRWVAAGAPYESHWAFEPPARPEPPAVERAEWPRNDIDRFVLARLEAEGLAPAPEADRRTLARRLSFDLTGLPPDPDEVDAFVADPAPDAYERLVERWMSGAAWGEQRARHWLDLARYADTHGIHFDNYRDIWPYRDWVIAAFADDVPYDVFSSEQLAGDLFPEPSIEQRVATGFLRCNVTTNEGGIIDEEYKVLYARDRTETFGQVWLGLTVGCAVCHDHKYDPLTQRDFYALSAYFDNTTVPVRDENRADPGPVARVTPVEERARRARLADELEAVRNERAARERESADDFEAWVSSTGARALVALLPGEPAALSLGSPEPLEPLEEAGRRAVARVAGEERTLELAEGSAWVADGPTGSALAVDGGALALAEAGDLERDAAFTTSAWVRAGEDAPTGALWSRMDAPNGHRGWDVWLEGRRVGMHLVHDFPENWLKVVAKAPLPADAWTHVAVTYDGSSAASGVAVYYDGIRQEVDVEADRLDGSTRTGVPFRVGTRTGANPTRAQLADLRIDHGVLGPDRIGALGLAHAVRTVCARGLAALPAEDRTRLHTWWLGNEDEAWRRLSDEERARRDAIEAIDDASPTAHVFAERDEEPAAYVLERGEYDRRGAVVPAGTPGFLPPLREGAPASRLALADWLFRPDHPLTARVAANRFWQEVFGTGLVASSGDFGVAGESPSHPALLDWLAVEFRERGWSVKELFRLMVTSATYRQSARITPEALERDPDNRLLSRSPRHRLDAEELRDMALAASGLLVREVGGPSVKPYQPPGVWEAVAMLESNTHDYVQDRGDALWRRSLYTFWKRAAPPASLEILGAPSREFCTVQRERTNTPLQALVLLNGTQFVEASRALAALALRERIGTDDRMDLVMRRLNARALRAGEREVCRAVLDDLLRHYGEQPDAAARLLAVGEAETPCDEPEPALAAWTMFANMLMNLDETVTR